ncbi:hypothetical protein C7Y66_04045 [Chroococcidiopsis sp. CCALA 051]|uniref:DUF1822 family protein n=1 Tax=Chroococcidiopsis sp. CCALA 051 TaxID=869949 RepID=UPI000D0CB4D8|nr:DUF1822 family protein [Chroococcidiopsis sp. CCALA 051]PSM50470.1 hypothetical protein C7Y66_04045 [Chroococcidiopsis sp. CCALA 051]
MNYQARENDRSLPLPITQAANSIAWQFSQQQPTSQKAEQVRLNTLAVCAVRDYLEMMGVPVNWNECDSWNPFMRACVDAADLEVLGLGRLECRAIATDASTCYVPPEVWEDRIGYVVVRLDEVEKQVCILGFVQQVTQEQLTVNQLRSPEDLLSHLQDLSAITSLSFANANPPTSTVNLRQWFQNTFEPGWQTVVSLLNPAEHNLTFSFRKTEELNTNEVDRPENFVRRAKLIDLGMQLAGHAVALVMELRPASEQKTDLIVQVHPTGRETFLPPSLQLIVLDESGSVFLEAKARRADNYIQLQFSGTTGERFSVKVALGDVGITEHFII